MTIRWAPADEIMRRWRPGSYDTAPRRWPWQPRRPWTWEDEAADLDSRGELTPVIFSIRLVGVLAPVLLGDDGTVWGGHHRILGAFRAGELVPFEVHPDADWATRHELAGTEGA